MASCFGAPCARAMSLDDALHSPVESVEEALPFLLNPALGDTRHSGFGGVVAKASEESETGEVSSSKAEVDETSYGGALTGKLGSGAAVSARAAKRAQKSSLVQGGSLQSGAEIKKSEYAAQLVLRAAGDFFIGAVFRYHTLERVGVDSFDAANTDGNFKGSLSSLGAGAAYQTRAFALGVAYALPAQGKVSTRAESKLAMEPGYLISQAHYRATSATSIGVSYTKYAFAKDELSVAGAISASPATYLDGSYCYERLAVGIDHKLASEVYLSPSIAIRKHFFTSQDNPQQTLNSSTFESYTHYPVRVVFSFRRHDVHLNVGASYSKHSHTVAALDGVGGQKTTTVEQIFNASINVGF